MLLANFAFRFRAFLPAILVRRASGIMLHAGLHAILFAAFALAVFAAAFAFGAVAFAFAAVFKAFTFSRSLAAGFFHVAAGLVMLMGAGRRDGFRGVAFNRLVVLRVGFATDQSHQSESA